MNTYQYVNFETCMLLCQNIAKPYPEIVVDTEQLFNNPNWPAWIRNTMKATPRYLSWNNMEKLGACTDNPTCAH